MRSIVQEQRKITESCLSFSIRCFPLFLDDPHQHPLGLPPDLLINEVKRLVGNGRTTPAFPDTVGVDLPVADPLPGMENNLPSAGIAVGRVHTVKEIFGFDPPLTVPPFPDDVLPHGRAVAVHFITDHGILAGGILPPWMGSAPMADQEGICNAGPGKIPDKEPLVSGMDRQVNQNEKGSVQLISLAVIQRFPGFAAVVQHFPDNLLFRFVRHARKSQENQAEEIKDMFP